MNDLNDRELLQEFKYLQITNASLLSAIPLIHLVGYGLLILAMLNVLVIVIPLHFFDPNWLLVTLEQLITNMPLIFIALLFVFYGQNLYRDRREQRILRVIHFFCLGYGILLLLLVPLGIIDSTVIYESNNQDFFELIKIATKSNIGALISGILSIEIWRRNKWIQFQETTYFN